MFDKKIIVSLWVLKKGGFINEKRNFRYVKRKRT